ncbi:hypothetical protein [Streptomyces sp. NPDC093990]
MRVAPHTKVRADGVAEHDAAHRASAAERAGVLGGTDTRTHGL